MSVKKVKISELPQLQPDASGEGLFMPAADENNHTYRVPLSRYDNAKNEADKAASVAEKAAEGAMTAAQEANDAADRANDAAEKANDIVDNKIVVANSLSFGYRENGAVFAPPLSARGTSQDAGSLIYRLGKAYTIDTVLPTSGDLGALLKDACQTGGDVSVQFSGRYNNGWSGLGTYNGVGEVHLMNGVPTAVVTDLGEDPGTRWLFVPNQWTKLGGAGDGAAEALAAAKEAKTTATAAQATADEAKDLATPLAELDTVGRVYSPDYPANGVTLANLTHNVMFAQGKGMVVAPLLAPGYSLKQAILELQTSSVTVTFKLNGSYQGGWTPTGVVNGIGIITIFPNGLAIAMMGVSNPVAYRGMHVFISGGWESILSPSSLAASLDMDGAEARTVPAASEEPSAGVAASEAREVAEGAEASGALEESGAESGEAVPVAVSSDTAPAVEAEAEEAETEAELGEEAIETMENLTAGK